MKWIIGIIVYLVISGVVLFLWTKGYIRIVDRDDPPKRKPKK